MIQKKFKSNQRSTAIGSTLLFVLISTVIFAQRPVPSEYPLEMPVNYIRYWDVFAPETNANNLSTKGSREAKQVTDYLDGFGRLLQTVVKSASLPTGGNPADMVSMIEYDVNGRESFKYLPTRSTATNGTENNGSFKLDPFAQQASFYNTNNSLSPVFGQQESFFYAQVTFENSPSARVKEVAAAGNSWSGTMSNNTENMRRSVKTKYYHNTDIDEVRIWTVTPGSVNTFSNYSSSQVYPAGKLNKTITVDEHGKQIIEFTDVEGKLILKKVQLTALDDNGTGRSHTNWLCTYYIYNNLNYLSCVVQPRGVQLLASNSWDMNALSGGILNGQCFRYEYDERNRMIMKKIPDASVEYMIYDARDRLIMTQDGKLRNTNPEKWLVTMYDNITNRAIKTGLVLNSAIGSKSFGVHRSDASVSIAYPFATEPLTGWELLTEIHYDNYTAIPSGLSGTLNNTSVTSSNFFTVYNSSPVYAQAIVQSNNTKGLVTWTRTKVLGTTAQYLTTVNIYDDFARLIQVQAINITGGIDITTMQYNYSGHLIRSHIKHQKLGTTTQNHEIATSNTYDDLGRLTKVEKMVNGSTWKTTSIFEYDALGNLKTKKLGSDPVNAGSPLETLNYDYNIRNWLLGANRNYIKSTNTNYFGFELGYDQSNTIITNTNYLNPEFNGNIAGTVWRSKGDNVIRKYDYTYDVVNRIIGADFNEYENSTFTKNNGIDFSVGNLTYDANGNIKTIQQKGWKIGGAVIIDDLSYNYLGNGNRLKNVIDNLNNDPQTTLGDFRYSQNYTNTLGNNKLVGTVDYSYDESGNLKSDKNKDITSITYNHLNLPNTITITAKGSIEYVYDAAGNKLKKIVHETGKPDKTTLYLAGTYEDDVLQFLPHEEGRIRYNATTSLFNYDYFIKDHLGNVRMTLTEEQQRDVYPAATLEGNINTDGTPNAVYIEKNYYTIDPAYIVPQADATGITAYKNNNGANAPNNNPNSLTGQNSTKLYKLNSSTNKTGLGITLKVMAGDIIDIYGKSYYFQNNVTEQNVTMPLSEIISGFLGSATAVTAGKGATTAAVTALNQSAFPATFFTRTPPAGNVIPNAYINYIFFDEQFKYAGNAGSGYSKAGINGQIKNHITSLDNIVVPKNGYLYVYVSNQSPVDVFFDNLQVIHTRGAILDETHYYPFGLIMAGISSKAAGSLTNKFKYNGKEEQRQEFSDGSGLEWLDFGARMYDNQIMRWTTVDPHADKFNWQSPYVAMDNNPMNIIDPTGKSGEPVIDQKNKTITVTSNVTFYGSDGSAALATKAAQNIQSQWNAAGGKVTIGSDVYDVKFVVTGTYDNSITATDISNNTDIKNNYIKIVASGIDVSYMDGAGSNTGVFLVSNINDPNSTTETHEFGHGFGLDHPVNTDLRSPAGSTTTADPPGIMYPRGTAVDAQYTYDPSKGATSVDPTTGARTNTMNPTTRKVNQTDINNLGLDKLTYDPTTGKAQLGILTSTAH